MASTLGIRTAVPHSLQEMLTAGGGQSSALRRIKNDLTGHPLRKVEYIRNGLLPALAEILFKNLAEPPITSAATQPKREDEIVFTHIAHIACVIASGRELEYSMHGNVY